MHQNLRLVSSKHRFVRLGNKNDESLTTRRWHNVALYATIVAASICFFTVILFIGSSHRDIDFYRRERSNRLYFDFPPLSRKSPEELGISDVSRPDISRPGHVFGTRLNRLSPLPTNSWCENILVGKFSTDSTNGVFAIPYLVDTAGPILGLRSHPTFIFTTDESVLLQVEPDSGVTLGAVEIDNNSTPNGHTISDDDEHLVPLLSIALEWNTQSPKRHRANKGPRMRTSIVRGAPYSSMEYIDATPRIMAVQKVDFIRIDEMTEVSCSTDKHLKPFHVKREIELHFKYNDHTWLIFVSQPTWFTCHNIAGHHNTVNQSAVEDSFDMRATSRMTHGMVRIAMSNNCTTGRNRVNCVEGQPKDKSEVTAFANLLRSHADVFPTSPKVSFDLDAEVVVFDWLPARMSDLHKSSSHSFYSSIFSEKEHTKNKKHKHGDRGQREGHDEDVLMYALPHHVDLMRRYPDNDGNGNGNGNAHALTIGCTPTLQGLACPAVGPLWLQQHSLPVVSFTGTRPVRTDLVDALNISLQHDLDFELPLNYRRGAGDTYFSGKMLAKLARILVIAEMQGYDPASVAFSTALDRLRAGTEIWLNGSAKAPFLYDTSWGGLVSCGCSYVNVIFSCENTPPDCPALVDPGQNYGNGFYNDHHFQYGYFIYAAAVIVKFDRDWGRRFHQLVMLLVRDIANPSQQDGHFPAWRHKDWFTGNSWANGIITQGGRPNPNGRNAESSAEAIAAYEAVALYGQTASSLWLSDDDVTEIRQYDASLLTCAAGRLLLSSELEAVHSLWHVRAAAPDVTRVYPPAYAPKVVGMMWSRLVQQQTWFGSEVWKSYGIQLLTVTPASELRDELGWVEEMLPVYNASCVTDPRCAAEGWSLPIVAAQASMCAWKDATDAFLALPDIVFDSAGGNGNSRSNCLWWTATRPCT